MIFITFNINYFLLILIKLILSTLFSFIIAFEREFHTHPGGICTHILVGYGSCLFTIISIHFNDNYSDVNSLRYDPARICAQIISGMGFLGSATIFKSDNYVKGINTAANLWISAAISMGIGADLWELSFITSLFTMLILIINNIYKKKKYSKNNNKTESEDDKVFDHNILDAPYGDEELNIV